MYFEIVFIKIGVNFIILINVNWFKVFYCYY